MLIILAERILSLRIKIFFLILVRQIAKIFGYPQNPGIPKRIFSISSTLFYRNHETLWPIVQFPNNLIELFFGTMPVMNLIQKVNIYNDNNGPFSFYVEHYNNIRFLPNFLSKFLQVKLNLCLNLDSLEHIREILFISFMVYADMIAFRIILILFWGANPRKIPFKYFCVLIDWFDVLVREKLKIPTSIFGLNGGLFAFIWFLGFLADNINNLVFTMPFLPCEAEKLINTINDKRILVFRYFPLLWYKYSIPNDMKEFWDSERPDIIKYMTIVYKDLNLKILPIN